MGDYLHRVLDGCLASEWVPAGIRTKLMRKTGYDVSKTCTIWAKASFRSKKVSIGSNVFINVGFFFDGYDQLTVGNNVRFGQFVRVLTATHDIGAASQRGPFEVLGRPVTISDGCWVGSGAVIMPGVSVAKGCVIAANAVLNDSTEEDGLYAGNPARRVRELEPSADLGDHS